MGLSPAAGFVIGALVLTGTVGTLAARAKASPSEEIATIPSDARTYGFVVHDEHDGVALLEATQAFTLRLANGPVQGAPPGTAQLARGRAIVARELDRYPASFLRKIRLAGVVFTSALVENTIPIPSLPNVGGLLLLDTHASEPDLVRVFHHELFHFFDLAEDGVLAPDAVWTELNPPGFRYGGGGRSLRGTWAANPTTELTGVLSGYATSGVEEDKAELFSFALTAPVFVKARAATDRVVQAKLGELSRRIGKLDADAPRRLGLD